MVSKGDRFWGWWDALRIWNGNAVKFGYDDCCTPLNVITLIKNKKRMDHPKEKKKP